MAQEELVKAIDLFTNYDEKVYEEILKNEDVLDWYEDQLDTYLVKLSRIALSDEASDNVSKMLHVITDFERIGDHALNIAQLAKKYNEQGSRFSDMATSEIKILSDAIKEILGFAIESFNENDLASAAQVEPLEEAIDALTGDMMDNHIDRLVKGECTIELGFMLSDLINNCERVSDHCSNIAVCVIEVSDDEYFSHQYLNDVKHESEAFKALYRYYLDKYSVKR